MTAQELRAQAANHRKMELHQAADVMDGAAVEIEWLYRELRSVRQEIAQLQARIKLLRDELQLVNK